jgi:hypothetical protein
VCYRRDLPQLSYVADHDDSNDVTYCVPLHEVVDVGKALYWGFKLFKLLKSLPPPPIPP